MCIRDRCEKVGKAVLGWKPLKFRVSLVYILIDTRSQTTRSPLSPVLFNFYIDDAIKKLKNILKLSYTMNGYTPNTVLFADDQLVLASNEHYFTLPYLTI